MKRAAPGHGRPEGRARAGAVFVFLATLFGLAYAFTTPPCYVPDEVAHFWRAVSIAHGALMPAEGKAPLPKGYEVFVFVVMHGQTQLTRNDYETAWSIDQKAGEIVRLRVVPSSYSPANYLPQIAAAAIGRATGARPMVVFYLGRLFALAAFIAVAAFAIRVTPFLQWGFVAAGLLPMTLFMAASWSADSMTIALSFAVTALALRGARDAVSPLAAFLLGLCKPLNFLVSTISRRWVVPIAAIAGFVLLTIVSAAAPPSSQWACVKSDPLRFGRVVVRDFAANVPMYADQMVGRLGRLDVVLPRTAIWLEWLLLAAIVLTAGESVPRAQRARALVVSLALMLSVSAWMYLTWTKVCGDEIAGIQGRYYLPFLPALMIALSNPWWRWRRPGAIAVSGAAIIANVAGVVFVAIYYFF